jgi:hypothetical protein
MRTLTFSSNGGECCNPSLGLATKARGCKVTGQEEGSSGVKAKALQGCGPRGSPGVTSHTPGSVRKCEGVWGSEPSHSQGNSHFRKWSPGGLPKLQKIIAGVKTQWLVAFFISLKSSRRELQLCFRPHLNRRSSCKVMGLQNCGSPSWRDFGTPTRESREK